MALDARKHSSRDFPKLGPNGKPMIPQEPRGPDPALSSEALERFVALSAEVIQDKIAELAGEEFAKEVPEEALVDAAGRISLMPGTNDFDAETMRRLLADEPEVLLAAKEIIGEHPIKQPT